MSLLQQVSVTPVARDERRALTVAAQQGDQEAYLALLADLAPNLKSLVRNFADAIGDRDEAESVALLGFTEAIAAYSPKDDPEGVGVVGILSDYVRRHLADAASLSHVVAIPPRTSDRYWSILKRADGDANDAAALAPSFGMETETFWRIHGAVSGASPLSDDLVADVPGLTVEDQDLAVRALRSVHGVHRDVSLRAYGFHEYAPQSDAEIAGDLGMSRPTVQRRRQEALGVMREAVGV